jgi:NOL1/NOP2/sun family putative RNA methylase
MENIPEFLIDMLEEQYGIDLASKILEGYSFKRNVSFRVNTLKSDSLAIENKLIDLNIKYKKVDWSKDAFVLEDIVEKDIEETDMYKNGEIYLQSLSSMLPPIILNPKQGADILDMAAAPGGKTTQMSAITQNQAHITACELNKIRAERLKFNIEKQGASCVYVMVKDSRKIDDFFAFDQILLDAPCSGSGTLNSNDSNIKKYFTKNLIEKSTKSQIELLKKAIRILKPGGKLVYSTCSILQAENEEIVEKAIKGTDCKIVSIDFKGIEDIPVLPCKINGALCVSPNEFYEGFFIAKLQKNLN